MNHSGPVLSEDFPEVIETEDQLEEVLSRPSSTLVEFIKTVGNPLVILGAGGKMGPSLAVLAKRAALAANHPLTVFAVSRFTDPIARQKLEQQGVSTISCDLLNDKSVASLPDTANVLYLVGLKFGTSSNPAMTWAVNTLVPARVAERYASARLVALSTGNVYPLTQVSQGGSREDSPLTPSGEYANAAVGRERIFQYCSQSLGVRIVLLRLFYAVEFRYGVLVDIAQKVFAGEIVDVTNGYFNCIWQRDANEAVLRALALADAPPSVWNLCRPEIFSVRQVASQFGDLLGRPPKFQGVEAATALLGNAQPLCEKLGAPGTGIEPMLRWISHWVKTGGCTLGRPTHFEVRDGNY
jgi:nucleoside-diphosphate-sugar epimerase